MGVCFTGGGNKEVKKGEVDGGIITAQLGLIYKKKITCKS